MWIDLKTRADLHVLLLSLLLVLLIVSTLDIPVPFGSWSELLTMGNVVPLVGFLSLIYILYTYYNFSYALKGTTEIPFKVKRIRSINYRHLYLLRINPFLPLLGFHIYEADGSFKTGTRDSIVIISREKLKRGVRVAYIKLGTGVYYVKKFGSVT